MRLIKICKGDKIGSMKIKSLGGVLFMFALAVAALAAAPTFTSVSPTQAQQGAIKELAIIGTNFDSTTTMEVSGTGVIVASVTAESSTSLRANIVIATNATVGTRNIVLYNSGEAAVTAANAFTVTLSGTGPAISQIKFDKVFYTVPMIAAVYPTVTVNPTYEVYFKVTSTLPATLSAGSLNATVLTTVVTGDASIADVHAFGVSFLRSILAGEITTVNSTEVTVFATIEAGANGIARGNILQVYFAASDFNSGTTNEPCFIYSALEPSNDSSPIKPPATIESVKVTDKVVVVAEKHVLDLNTDTTLPLAIAIAQGQSIQNFTIYMTNVGGGLTIKRSYRLSSPATNQYKITFALNSIKSSLGNGMYIFKVIDDDKNKQIGGGRQVILTK